MTDINGHVAVLDDIICMAFRSGNFAQLRKGRVLELIPGDKTKSQWSHDYQDRAKVQWLSSSYLGLPESKATKVILRDYVIVS